MRSTKRFKKWPFLILALFFCSVALATEAAGNPFAHDLYERLGVAKTASLEEIKNAYRLLAKNFHPQNFGRENDEFALVTQAYKVLKDPSKRETYDQEGLTAFQDLEATWQARAGNRGKENAGSYSRSDHKSYEERKNDLKRSKVDLYTFLKIRKEDLNVYTDEQTQEFLSNLFRTLGEYNIDKMMEKPHFSEMMEMIYDEPVWKNSDPELLRAFVSGAWLRSIWWTEHRELGAFLGKFSPDHPAIQSLIDRFNSYSPEKRLNREDMGPHGKVFASMLREEPYRGTPAGEKLLDQIYGKWTQFGNHYLGVVDRDDLTPKLLSLLDFPEWRKNYTLAKIARVPPEKSQYDRNFEEYEELKKKYPEVFPYQSGHRPASSTSSSSSGSGSGSAATSSHLDPTAECMKNMINNFFDPFGFFKK
jgi:curved DNA-binding protein CbpA